MTEAACEYFYTLSVDRWGSASLGYFDTWQEARDGAVALRHDLIGQSDETAPIPDMQIEKILVAPMTRKNLIHLLEHGVEKLIRNREVVEIVNEPQREHIKA